MANTINQIIQKTPAKPMLAKGLKEAEIVLKQGADEVSHILFRDGDNFVKEAQIATQNGANIHGIPLNGVVFAPKNTFKEGNIITKISEMVINSNKKIKRTVVKNPQRKVWSVKHQLFDTQYGDMLMSTKEVKRRVTPKGMIKAKTTIEEAFNCLSFRDFQSDKLKSDALRSWTQYKKAVDNGEKQYSKPAIQRHIEVFEEVGIDDDMIELMTRLQKTLKG